MARKSRALEFRKPRPRKLVSPGPVRTNKLKFSRRSGTGGHPLLAGVIFVPAIFLAGLMVGEQLTNGGGSGQGAARARAENALELRIVRADGVSPVFARVRSRGAQLRD